MTVAPPRRMNGPPTINTTGESIGEPAMNIAVQVPLRPRTSTPTAIASPAMRRPTLSGSGSDMTGFGERVRARGAGPIERVEGVKRDDGPVGLDEVDARALDRAEVEVEAVQELRDHHAEGVLVDEAFGRGHLGQAAQQRRQFL